MNDSKTTADCNSEDPKWTPHPPIDSPRAGLWMGVERLPQLNPAFSRRYDKRAGPFGNAAAEEENPLF